MAYDGIYERKSQSDKCVEVLMLWIAENGITQFKVKDAKEIAFKAGVKETNFKYALKAMQDTGNIKNGGFGIYDIVS